MKQNHKTGIKPGMPSRAQILEFLQTADTIAGKREIAKAFGLKGQEKIALKALLKDMAEEGLIDGRKTAFHRMGGVPKVTVLRVVEIEDGEAFAVPDTWQPDDAAPPPRLRVIEARREGRRPAPRAQGRRPRSRAHRGGRPAGWRAHPMKKLPARTDGLLGVVEIDGAGKAGSPRSTSGCATSSPIADLGGAEEGQLVLAEPAGKSPRSGVKVVEVLGDPLAPRAFSLIAIHKHGIPHVFAEETLAEAERAAKLPLAAEHREDLRALPIVAIDPADARDHDDAIWAEPDGEGGFRAVVAIADVSFYVRPGGELDREARKRGNSVYFPDRVVPMLPEVLSADVCSPAARRGPRGDGLPPAASTPQGKVTSWRFTRAIVRIAETIAYEDAQAGSTAATRANSSPTCGARGSCSPPRAMPAIRWSSNCPSGGCVLDEHGKIAEIAMRERLDAHRVVEDFMIAANVAAAKALEAKTAPVVYRVHEPPSREKLVALKDYMKTFGHNLALGQVITPGLFNRMLKDIADESEKALVMEAVLRSQTQAYYGPRNAGHFGLALGSYAHFTSPIRRYADLLVHRALVDAFKLEQPQPPGSLPPHQRPVRPRPRRPVEGVRSDQQGRAPRDGGRARHHRPLRRRMAIEPRGRGVPHPHHRGAELRLLRHDRRAGRRRAGPGLHARPRVFHLRRSRAAPGRRGQRHELRAGRQAGAAAGRGQPADRRAQVRTAGRRRPDRTARQPPAAQINRKAALEIQAARGQAWREQARTARQHPPPGREALAARLSSTGRYPRR